MRLDPVKRQWLIINSGVVVLWRLAGRQLGFLGVELTGDDFDG
jgi:hypothetical protein